jgi:hypothetical protein
MFAAGEVSDNASSLDGVELINQMEKESKMRLGLNGLASDDKEEEGDTKKKKKMKKKDKERKKKKGRQEDDEYQGDVTPRPPTPETHPVYREKARGPARRPKEGFPWDLRESWHPYHVYISATPEDHISELQLVFDEVLRDLQEEAASKRIRVTMIYLQDGLSAAEVHKCGVGMRLREMQRSNCTVLLQGRTYGDIPPTEELAADLHVCDWLKDYPSNRSYQELEAAMAIPALRGVPEKDRREKQPRSKEERQHLREDLAGEWESADPRPVQKVIVAQRNADVESKLPETLHLVFKDASYDRMVLQRQLRMRSLKALQGAANAATLDNYRCEFKSLAADGTYRLGDLAELQDFLVREASLPTLTPKLLRVFPDSC